MGLTLLSVLHKLSLESAQAGFAALLPQLQTPGNLGNKGGKWGYLGQESIYVMTMS